MTAMQSYGNAAPGELAVGGMSGGRIASGLSVQVCGRLMTVPAESASSLVLLNRHLTQQLKLGGHASLQLADVAGKVIAREEDLAAALREGRHPLRASMTVSVLREIEQRKSEVESKKEELAQCQWQVVVDQMVAVTEQATGVAALLQSVRSECQEMMQQARAEESMRAERMEESITRESQQREVGLRDIETKMDKIMQALYAERSARDVVSHQLSAQLDAVVAGVEADRSIRDQERAEMKRQYDAVKHQVDVEQARNEEQWNWHMETTKRLDARLEERTTADIQQQQRMAELESNNERLRSTLASVENALAMTKRTMEELTTRRQEELSKAVRDEMVGRENQIARFAKELEASWQGLEARLTRSREEAASATSGVTQRIRVLEQRCAEVEKGFTDYSASHSEQFQAISEKANRAASAVDAIEVGLKSSDVVTNSTVARVDDMFARLNTLEEDCRTKVNADYWAPQMDALQRADQRFETKLQQLEKDVMGRLQAEAAQRDGMKMQFQSSLAACIDKIAPPKATGSPTAKKEETGLVTPRTSYASPNSPQTIAPTSCGALALAHGMDFPTIANSGIDGRRLASPTRPRLAIVPNAQPMVAFPSAYGGAPVQVQAQTPVQAVRMTTPRPMQ